ncbi:hypothetical protein SAY87_018225 [Trapa incisa]|uniref:Uncharacterized protein n=1 Tax=Trapa incisa TaxID=236973 RepID=A0AAN7QWT5_9MYRT|nr:hypothetical protein SAY87_018225 [Trapa incisa]
MMAGSLSGRRKEVNQNEWSQYYVFEEHKSSVNSVSWAPHELGLCLACGSSDGHPYAVPSISWAPQTLRGALVWKISNGIWEMDCFPAPARDVARAPNTGLPKSGISGASHDGKVIIWIVTKEGYWKGIAVRSPVWRIPFSWSFSANVRAMAGITSFMNLWDEAVNWECRQDPTATFIYWHKM